MNVWRLVDPWFPALHVWWLEPQLQPRPPLQNDVDSLTARLQAQGDPARAASSAEAVASAENSRLDRLEAKLDSQRTVITAVAPFTLGLIAWSVRDDNAPGFICSSLAAVYLAVAYLMAMRGGSTRARYVLGGDQVESLAAGTDLGFRVPAARIAYARGNTNYGVHLSNQVWASQRCVLVASLLSGGAGYFFVAGGGLG